jgi:lysophospholipase L1-like esterase
MKLTELKKSAAVVSLAALAACGGGGGGMGQLVPSSPAGREQPNSILTKIVGVGDSLTAGFQSDAFLGETGIQNPFYHIRHQIPPSQENGWWALLDEQASGLPLDSAIAKMYDPSTSPLPLIEGPGLGNMLVSYTPFSFPFNPLITGDTCSANNGFNAAGYRLKDVARVRMDPKATIIRDVGIPGLTLHEANGLHQPQTSTCKFLPGIPGLINQVVAQESGTFWPVLENFTYLGPYLTDVNAAASRHPTLATVWLGANDVLKYMGSGGRFVGGDRNSAQAAADIRQAVGTLQHAGARVVVANLPNVLETGYFQRISIPRHSSDCRLATYAYCTMSIALGPSSAGFAISEAATKFHLATPGGCIPASVTKPCGYLTLAAIALIIPYYNSTGHVPNLDCNVPAPGCKGKLGNGLGPYYITPEFAAKIQTLNDAINDGIDDAATSSHVPLVDIQAIFAGLASGNPSNPYFHAAASINPPLCCTLGFLWGILSFDGLHPSNTGYALIASDFIKTINRAYGTHIPDVDVKAVYNGTRCSTRKYCFPDPYAPPHDSPY